MTKPRLVFFISEDWYFWSHRLPLAQAARDAGYDVYIMTRVSSYSDKILKAQLNLIQLKYFQRKYTGLYNEVLSLIEIIGHYRRIRPSLVHHVALKPIVYGMVASRITGVDLCINALGGLGHLFASTNGRVKRRMWGRELLLFLLRWLLIGKHVRVIVQNTEDLSVLIKHKVINRDRTTLISGSGVDLGTFTATPEPTKPLRVLLASRMIWEKGIREFVEASQIIDQQFPGIAQFILVGTPDSQNPSSIPELTLQEWTHKYKFIEWWGHCSDMPNVLKKAHIVCLPSYYGEGVPKILLEAAACGRPIVTTNTPGCRETIIEGESGLLVEPHDSNGLAEAILRLLLDRNLRIYMGQKGRELAEARFSVETVVTSTLGLYQTLLSYNT